MAGTIWARFARLPVEYRRALVGHDGALLDDVDDVREMGPVKAAAVGWRSWACPDYLAGALGVEYRCPDPPGSSAERCQRCAAAFLRMRI